MDLTRLDELLRAGRWLEADLETNQLLVEVSELKKINSQGVKQLFDNKSELLALDNKWLQYSYGRFGFSVQSKIHKSIYSYNPFSETHKKAHEILLSKSAKNKKLKESLSAVTKLIKIQKELSDYIIKLFLEGNIDELSKILSSKESDKSRFWGWLHSLSYNVDAPSSIQSYLEEIKSYLEEIESAENELTLDQVKELSKIVSTIEKDFEKQHFKKHQDFLYTLGWLTRKGFKIDPSLGISKILKAFEFEYNFAEIKFYTSYSKKLKAHGNLNFSLTAPYGHLPASYVYNVLANDISSKTRFYDEDDLPLSLDVFYYCYFNQPSL